MFVGSSNSNFMENKNKLIYRMSLEEDAGKSNLPESSIS